MKPWAAEPCRELGMGIYAQPWRTVGQSSTTLRVVSAEHRHGVLAAIETHDSPESCHNQIVLDWMFARGWAEEHDSPSTFTNSARNTGSSFNRVRRSKCVR